MQRQSKMKGETDEERAWGVEVYSKPFVGEGTIEGPGGEEYRKLEGKDQEDGAQYQAQRRQQGGCAWNVEGM